ncbi:MAG: PilZ domain-containing protein [Deltaproteobacteria bacterium]|nr:MAG: PilZ domain-containing protein [Deltaproteobacteria bacterium]
MFQVERRKYLRVRVDTFVSESGEGMNYLGRTLDIGEGGLRYMVPAGRKIPAGKKVKLRFSLPECETDFELDGTVVGTDDVFAGKIACVKFNPVRERQARRLRDFVVDRKRKEILQQLEDLHLS